VIDVKMTRTWAMPSRHTFTIKPVAAIIKKYSKGIGWVDPFSGWNSPAIQTNDLNPDAPTTSHTDAQTFIEKFDCIDGMLFDPPYSPRQISECYKGMGLKVGMKETQNATLYARVKNAAMPRIVAGGIVICCGWNSGGMGEKRGFELLEIMLVAHGGAHNDTIVTVERKK
jgi:hypothetical protein